METKTQALEWDANVNNNLNRVALQTMKDRCCMLQQKLEAVEKENLQLVVQCSKSKMSNSGTSAGFESLNARVAQLTKEKYNMTQRSILLECENQKLWSSLLQLSNFYSSEKGKNRATSVSDSASEKTEFVVPPLLTRSQTFTHYKTDPKLATKIEEENKEIKNIMQEFSLKFINGVLLEKSELVHQYEQMVEMQMNCDKTSAENSVGFTYLDNFNSASLASIKEQKEIYCNLKQLALKQRAELKECLNILESKKLDKNECNKCKNLSKNLNAISPTKEKLETTSSDVGLHDSSTRWGTATSLTSFNEEVEERLPPNRVREMTTVNSGGNVQNISSVNNIYYDTSPMYSPQCLKESGNKKNSKKICPMCGKCFINVFFDEFKDHVESHFIAENEFESILDNYDTVTNSIPNNFN